MRRHAEPRPVLPARVPTVAPRRRLCGVSSADRRGIVTRDGSPAPAVYRLLLRMVERLSTEQSGGSATMIPILCCDGRSGRGNS
jgi:hypothetical protein